MTKYGIKIVKEGELITVTDPRKILMSSEYAMLKYHAVVDNVVIINAGTKTSSVTIPHTLGYVPAFMAFGFNTDPFGRQSPLNQIGMILPVYGNEKFGNPSISAYATNTGITITVTLPENYGETTYSWDNPVDVFSDKYNARSYTLIGKRNGTAVNDAVKFDNVPIDKNTTIVSASLQHYAEYSWKSTPAQDMKIKTYGIDEDNTGDFGSNPMGRSRTSAVTSQNQNVIGGGEFFGTNVKDQVQEIINRNGWSNGNSIGFLIFDDGTPDGNATEDDSYRNKLDIVVNNGGSLVFDVRIIIFKDKIS